MMGDFHSAIGVEGIEMRNRRHDLSVSRVIAFQFVRDEPARFTALTFDHVTKEAAGGLCIASPLHKDINGVAILINRKPEVLMFVLNGDDGFIEVPRITQAALALLECASIGWARREFSCGQLAVC